MNVSEAMFYENYLASDFHTNTVISKTVIRPIKDLLYGCYLQVKNTTTKQNKTEHESVLLGKKFFIAGQCQICFQCIFGLPCNRGKQGILNYLKALTL